MQRIYFDVNARLGKTKTRDPMVPYTKQTLLDDMDRYRVHGALVEAGEARDYSYSMGNAELARRIAGEPRLFAAALVSPTLRFERNDPTEYLDSLDARAFVVRPRTLVHSLHPMTMENICGYMVDRRMPLLLDILETDFEAVRELLCAFPELRVLLLNVKWLFNRQLFPLLEKCPNLHVDLSANQAPDLPYQMKRHFGVSRLLFGSAYPGKLMGALKALIEYSRVSEAEKDAVASGNAMRLLGISRQALTPYETPSRLDALAQRMERGLPLDGEFIFDAHAHMLDESHGSVNFNLPFDSDERSVVRMMDALGIDQAIISPIEGLTTDGSSANETVWRAHERYPTRILPYACANPHFDEDIRDVVDIYHKQRDFRGLKPYWVYHELPLTHERYRPWFEYASEHRLFMLIHSGEPHIVPETDRLCDMYPGIVFLLGHSGISFAVARDNAALAKKRENVVLELNFTNLTRGVVEFLVGEVGADKVLFGTDMPMRDPGPQLAWVVYAQLPIEDKRKILGLNMKRIYERCR